MKKFLTTIILILMLYGLGKYYKEIVQFVMVNVVYQQEVLYKNDNKYSSNEDWMYVQKTTDFYPKSKQDILNIFYTGLNGGWDEITFYCDSKYTECIDDIKEMTDQSYLLSNINNFVKTYNTYNKIYVNMNNFGRVNITVQKLYSDETINIVNNKVEEIYNKLITDNMTDYEKIKVIHDYIINNTVYDQERANEVTSGNVTDYNYSSNTAYGALIQGKAICGGYTDAMALFLDKFGIKNYKISSEQHIWNYVYIDGSWKHLDLTWDDPVTSTGENVLTHNFFLINTETLESKNTGQHIYSKDVFLEAK